MMPKVHTAAASSSKKAPAPAPALPCFVLAVLLVATAVAPRAMAQVCDTSGISGTLEEANLCVQYVHAKESTPCCHTGASDTCTTMCFMGETVVEICGDSGTCTSCTEAADKLSLILQSCVANVNNVDRVSGHIDQFRDTSGANLKYAFQIRRVAGIL